MIDPEDCVNLSRPRGTDRIALDVNGRRHYISETVLAKLMWQGWEIIFGRRLNASAIPSLPQPLDGENPMPDALTADI